MFHLTIIISWLKWKHQGAGCCHIHKSTLGFSDPHCCPCQHYIHYNAPLSLWSSSQEADENIKGLVVVFTRALWELLILIAYIRYNAPCDHLLRTPKLGGRWKHQGPGCCIHKSTHADLTRSHFWRKLRTSARESLIFFIIFMSWIMDMELDFKILLRRSTFGISSARAPRIF